MRDTVQNWSLNAALEIANKRTLRELTVGEVREIIDSHADALRIRLTALELVVSRELENVSLV